MATQVRLDDSLLQEAVEIGRHKTKTEAVMAALRDYIRRRKQCSHLSDLSSSPLLMKEGNEGKFIKS